MKEPKKLEDMDYEDLKDYCDWEGAPCYLGGNGPIMCEGRFCERAYERYLEEFEEAQFGEA